jgi:multisubunit Na+/H+ antiporter MnhF subunit
MMNNATINVSEIARSTGAYKICIEENWSMNIIAFSMINIITIMAMMILHKKGKPGQSDRLINILFLFNVFALTVNVVIALGLKFLPV